MLVQQPTSILGSNHYHISLATVLYSKYESIRKLLTRTFSLLTLCLSQILSMSILASPGV